MVCQRQSNNKKGKKKLDDTIKFETETIKSSLCDYSDAFILFTGNITVTANNNADIAFKNCAPFSTCMAIGGGVVGCDQLPTPTFEICAPFFKNQETKIIKNWEKLSPSRRKKTQI